MVSRSAKLSKSAFTHSILSNSSSEFIYDLYKEFNPFSVLCSRNINSKGTGRGKVEEVIVIGNTLRKTLGL
jgi:site-specific DNA-adenine methylase